MKDYKEISSDDPKAWDISQQRELLVYHLIIILLVVIASIFGIGLLAMRLYG